MASTMLPAIFNLGGVPHELRPYVYKEEWRQRHGNYYGVSCQRTVYLTILTLRAIMSNAYPTHRVFWQIRDTFGISTRIYLFDEKDGSWVELADIFGTNDRQLVRGVKVGPHSLISAWELDGITGLRCLLVDVANTVTQFRPSDWNSYSLTGSCSPRSLGRLIQSSNGADGQLHASFIRPRA